MRRRRLEFSVGELDQRRVAMALGLLHALDRPRPRDVLRASLRGVLLGKIAL
jgi:hypothetical protein